MPVSLSDLFDKRIRKIGFFGLGSSNVALMEYLPLSDVEVVIRSDGRVPRDKIPRGCKIRKFFEGERARQSIREDVLVFSPSVRRDSAEFLRAGRRGVIFTSDAEMFFRLVRGKVFAVSGSDGKSSTAQIAAQLLRGREKDISPIGNFGVPMLPSLRTGVHLYVTELSSFNLSYLSADVSRAALTNITPNHLNWHSSFEEYRDTKLSLIKMAREGVVSFDDAEMRREFLGKSIFAAVSDRLDFSDLRRMSNSEVYITRDGEFIYRNGEKILEISKIKRRERHNVKNFMTALALTDGYIENDDILRTAESFCGLAHRQNTVASFQGVDFIDSSIDTTPSRTKTTLDSLGRSVVVILGGRGKGVGYDALLPSLKKYARCAVATGEDMEKIAELLRGEVKCIREPDFSTAVRAAISEAQPSDAVLLSPAATSYDAFSDYTARAEEFRKIVLEYCKNNETDV